MFTSLEQCKDEFADNWRFERDVAVERNATLADIPKLTVIKLFFDQDAGGKTMLLSSVRSLPPSGQNSTVSSLSER